MFLPPPPTAPAVVSVSQTDWSLVPDGATWVCSLVSLWRMSLPRVTTPEGSGWSVTSPAKPDLLRLAWCLILRYISSEACRASSVSIGSVEDSREDAGKDWVLSGGALSRLPKVYNPLLYTPPEFSTDLTLLHQVQ